MNLEPGSGFVLPAYTASTLVLENRTPAATTVQVGSAVPIELAPSARQTLAVPFDAETGVRCLGPGPVELAWSAAAEHAALHPDRDGLRARSLIADPWREAITTAWRKAFDPDAPTSLSLPAQLKRFDPVTLADARDIDLGKGFSTLCPGWDRGSSWADGNGRADLTGLILRELATARWIDNPWFSDSDRKVGFEFRVENLRLDGKCTLHQRCCFGVLGWCWYTGEHSGWNDFQLTLEAAVVRFEALAVDDPVLGVRVSVTDTMLIILGDRTLRFPGPDWLPDWLRFLTENWSQVAQFKAATQIAAEQALRQPAVRGVLQQVVNGWLGQSDAAARAQAGTGPLEVAR